jgi:hypothetical protein
MIVGGHPLVIPEIRHVVLAVIDVRGKVKDDLVAVDSKPEVKQWIAGKALGRANENHADGIIVRWPEADENLDVLNGLTGKSEELPSRCAQRLLRGAPVLTSVAGLTSRRTSPDA